MIPRLFVQAPLSDGAPVELGAEQAGYLTRVLRLAPGAEARLFNGRDGEWRARLVEAGKRGATLVTEHRTRPQTAAPDLLLLFAPLKRQATDWLVEKATELGVRALQPTLTRRTNAETVRLDRLQSIAREAAEQCERLDVPQVRPPALLHRLLEEWDARRPLLFADESGTAPPAAEVLAALSRPAALAVLVGPEGGFAPEERAHVLGCGFVRAISLGPRILRAETAAAAALTLAQSAWGDWVALSERGTSIT